MRRIGRSPGSRRVTFPTTSASGPTRCRWSGSCSRTGSTCHLEDVLVGENGSGKSTLVEAIAMAFGCRAEGGSTGSRHSTRETESRSGEHLRSIEASAGLGRASSCAPRRCTPSTPTSRTTPAGPRARVPPDVARGVVRRAGHRSDAPTRLYLLDEPESALSFTGCLALVGHLHDLLVGPSQVLVSTHSPLLAALPGATIFEVGEWGMRRSAWEDLALADRLARLSRRPSQVPAPRARLRPRAGRWSPTTAIVTVELLAPTPVRKIDAAVKAFPNAKRPLVQDEPLNQGPWSHMFAHL